MYSIIFLFHIISDIAFGAFLGTEIEIAHSERYQTSIALFSHANKINLSLF